MQHKISLTILLLFLCQSLFADSFLHIENIDSTNLPTVKTDFYFFNEEVLPQRNLDKEDIHIFNNSNTITDFELINSRSNSINNKKVLIYFDLSLDSTFREHSKKIITKLLNFNQPKQIEYHFIAFDMLNYNYNLNEIDSIKLFNYLEAQEFEYISDFEYSINSEHFNPFDYLNNLQGDKEILVFTNSRKLITNDVAIINKAINNNVLLSFYDMSSFGNSSLESLSIQTSGNYIKYQDNEENIAKLINLKLLNFVPSTLTYDLITDCNSASSVTYSMAYYSNTYSFDITIPDSLRPRLVSEPIDKNFANILAGEEDKQEFFIKAENGDIILKDIRLSDDNGGIFTISGDIDSTNEEPYLLREGEEYPIQIRFNPIDSALVFTQIVVTSNACFGNKINITGGFPNTPPTRTTLKWTYPNCNDTIFANDVIDVKWEGVLPRDVVQLEYSLDNGQNWDTLAKNVLNLRHTWNVPDIETEEAIFRVIQLWPNNIGKTLNLPHPNEQINSAFFSPDGNHIITATNMNKVVIWNSNSGEIEKELIGHSDEVYYAIFSHNGEYAATCSRDGRVIVWHTNPQEQLFGEVYRTYTSHNGLVYSVDFDINDENIISAGQDGTYRIFNLAANEVTFERNPGDGSVRFAKFSPDDNFYAVGGRNGICRLYDKSSHTLINEFDANIDGGSNQRITHIDISPDSKLISTCNGLNKEIAIWDIATETKIKTLFHSPSFDKNKLEIPNSAFFYFNNEDTLVISSGGNESIRWDLTKPSGEDSTATFLEHTSFVRTANYNFDASRVVTASWDGTAKVWKLKERDIQMDTSDCSVVITKPTISTQEFSFDYTLIGQERDSVFSSIITNTSKSSIVISEINIRGRDRDEFKLIDEYKSIKLNPNESLDVRVLFTPSVSGERLAQLEISIPVNTIIQNFSGFGYDSDVVKLNDVVDFENLEIGESKEINDFELIRNLSTENLQIDSIKIYDFNFDKFSYLSDNSINNNLESGDDLLSNLLFQTDSIGQYKTILKIYHNDIHQASKFYIFGNGIPPRVDTVSFKIESIDAIVGETISAPIFIDDISELGIIETITGFNIRLSYNKSILEPLFTYEEVNTIGDIKTIEFEIDISDRDALFEDNYIFKDLEFKVALGKAEFSPLTLETINPIGEGKIILDWTSGNVIIKNICNEGGARLIDTDGRFELTQNYPNPASNSTTIEIETIEKGLTHFYLMDSQGLKVKEFINSEIPAGRYEIKLDLKGIPNGVYFYILETPNMKDTKKIIINQ